MNDKVLMLLIAFLISSCANYKILGTDNKYSDGPSCNLVAPDSKGIGDFSSFDECINSEELSSEIQKFKKQFHHVITENKEKEDEDQRFQCFFNGDVDRGFEVVSDSGSYYYSIDNCLDSGEMYHIKKKYYEQSRVQRIKKIIKKNSSLKKFESIAIERKIAIGMPENILFLSFGKPERINQTVSRFSVSRQYVYGSIYVYSENGVVTSWQN